MKVRICATEHPHYPETGELTGETISVLGKPMAYLKLDSCRHGTDACYVGRGQVAELRDFQLKPKRKAGGK